MLDNKTDSIIKTTLYILTKETCFGWRFTNGRIYLLSDKIIGDFG